MKVYPFTALGVAAGAVFVAGPIGFAMLMGLSAPNTTESETIKAVTVWFTGSALTMFGCGVLGYCADVLLGILLDLVGIALGVVGRPEVDRKR
jgi:hypothetical protein